MSGNRIGELLSRLVPLSGHDIEEILSEQSATRKRFGDIALAMGLCRPEHVWKAWSSQLGGTPKRINLDDLGIDAQAVAHVSPETAIRLHLIPVRVFDDEIVVATDEASLAAATSALPSSLSKKVMFVLAERSQVGRAITAYYPRRKPTPHAEATAA